MPLKTIVNDLLHYSIITLELLNSGINWEYNNNERQVYTAHRGGKRN